MAQLDLQHLPYKGAGPALQDLVWHPDGRQFAARSRRLAFTQSPDAWVRARARRCMRRGSARPSNRRQLMLAEVGLTCPSRAADIAYNSSSVAAAECGDRQQSSWAGWSACCRGLMVAPLGLGRRRGRTASWSAVRTMPGELAKWRQSSSSTLWNIYFCTSHEQFSVLRSWSRWEVNSPKSY